MLRDSFKYFDKAASTLVCGNEAINLNCYNDPGANNAEAGLTLTYKVNLD